MINILILNWNSSIDIKNSLKNISESNYTNFRIILIDNDSKEEDKVKLVETYNEYKNRYEIYLVINDQNYGYAGGNNRGFDYLKEKKLDGDILILNPDVNISNNTLEELSNALSNDIGAVMTRTLNTDNSIMYDYIKLNGFKQKWLQTIKDIIETDYVAGSCMLLKREVLDKIALFDEDFFMYWEEVDLSFRIKKLGYKLISTTKTTITRKENSNKRSRTAVFYITRNSCIIYKKYKFFKGIDIFNYMLYLFISNLYFSLKKKDIYYSLSMLKGLVFGIKSILLETKDHNES